MAPTQSSLPGFIAVEVAGDDLDEENLANAQMDSTKSIKTIKPPLASPPTAGARVCSKGSGSKSRKQACWNQLPIGTGGSAFGTVTAAAASASAQPTPTTGAAEATTTSTKDPSYKASTYFSGVQVEDVMDEIDDDSFSSFGDGEDNSFLPADLKIV